MPVALCRPMLDSSAFPQPATVRQLAEGFVVTEAAIKSHLANLYDKFGIPEGTEARRVRLANEAIARQAVTMTMTDLRQQFGLNGSTMITELAIDGFEDVVQIGWGGFAFVFRARHVASGRDVAIKLLLHRPDPRLAEQLEHDARRSDCSLGTRTS